MYEILELSSWWSAVTVTLVIQTGCLSSDWREWIWGRLCRMSSALCKWLSSPLARRLSVLLLRSLQLDCFRTTSDSGRGSPLTFARLCSRCFSLWKRLGLASPSATAAIFPKTPAGGFPGCPSNNSQINRVRTERSTFSEDVLRTHPVKMFPRYADQILPI